ncbi:MAG: hypothetical protein ACOYJG_03790 [Prevotella sp.]|jgi:hypothetical protein
MKKIYIRPLSDTIETVIQEMLAGSNKDSIKGTQITNSSSQTTQDGNIGISGTDQTGSDDDEFGDAKGWFFEEDWKL